MVQRKIKGFGLSARGQISVSAPESLDLDFACDTPSDTRLQMKASAGKDGSFSVSEVKAVQTVGTLGGSVIVAPTYNLDSSKGDLSVAFAKDNINSIQVDVNTDKEAKLSLTQKLGASHILRPSITSDRQFELDYETRVDYGTITTTYKPNHHVNVKWSDGPWQANFLAPMDGYYNFKDGVKISVKTKVDVNPKAWY